MKAMTATTPIGIDIARRKLLAKVHLARKDLRLVEDSYRDVVERITGHRSAADCDDRQLVAVIEEFKRLGWSDALKPGKRRAVADGPQAKKARALFLSLWQLGEVDDPGEAVLAGFVKRQCGKDDLRFCHAGDLNKVIEGLKARVARAIEATGATVPADDDGHAWRVAVLRAQWRIVGRIQDERALVACMRRGVWPNDRPIDWYEDELLDAAIQKLGWMVRRKKAEARA